jgi:hypothetical protein
MKKITVLTRCIFCTLIISSCSNNKTKVQPQEQKETATKNENASAKTPRHIRVPNSSLYIILPPGFAASEISGTITTEEGHPDFMVMKIISGTTPEKFFSEIKEQADKNFPRSWKEEKVLVSGHKAKIYQAKTLAGSQYYLAFTDGYTDEMIIANYDESDIATGKQVYEALKTVVVEK